MLSRLACLVSHGAGHPAAAPLAMLAVMAGLTLAPLDAVNLAISIVSLALLFILQHTANTGDAATHAKLDALIHGVPDAPDEFAGLDKRDAAEIEAMRG